ncbi:hypothetical protein F4778DRAFT_721993 [Xylariomycetidae sp. FL2044]|nr:hypothetical protein F4778DRAFT_721993 [Xylariomycetidae sp. FL2044]
MLNDSRIKQNRNLAMYQSNNNETTGSARPLSIMDGITWRGQLSPSKIPLPDSPVGNMMNNHSPVSRTRGRENSLAVLLHNTGGAHAAPGPSSWRTIGVSTRGRETSKAPPRPAIGSEAESSAVNASNVPFRTQETRPVPELPEVTPAEILSRKKEEEKRQQMREELHKIAQRRASRSRRTGRGRQRESSRANNSRWDGTPPPQPRRNRSFFQRIGALMAGIWSFITLAHWKDWSALVWRCGKLVYEKGWSSKIKVNGHSTGIPKSIPLVPAAGIFARHIYPWMLSLLLFRLCQFSAAGNHLDLCQPQDVSNVKFGTFLKAQDQVAQVTAYGAEFNTFPLQLRISASEVNSLSGEITSYHSSRSKRLVKQLSTYYENTENAATKFRQATTAIHRALTNLIRLDTGLKSELDDAFSLTSRLQHNSLWGDSSIRTIQVNAAFNTALAFVENILPPVLEAVESALKELKILYNILEKADSTARKTIKNVKADINNGGLEPREFSNGYGLLRSKPLPIESLAELQDVIHKVLIYTDNANRVLKTVHNKLQKAQGLLSNLHEDAKHQDKIFGTLPGKMEEQSYMWLKGLNDQIRKFERDLYDLENDKRRAEDLNTRHRPMKPMSTITGTTIQGSPTDSSQINP